MTATFAAASAIPAMAEIPVVNLRNGTVGEVVAITPSSAIPAKYYWAHVSGVPNAEAPAFLELNMRATFCCLRANAADMDAERARSEAIVLGALRTGMRTFYNLEAADFSAGEMAPRLVTYTAARPGTPAVPATPTTPEIPAREGQPAGATLTAAGGTANAVTAAWNAWTALTPAEIVIAKWHYVLAAAIVPTQGWSIVKTGHHFLSEAGAGARSGWNAVVRQFRGKVPAEVTGFMERSAVWWEDVCFHKAGHPIAMSLKVEIAGSADTHLRLKAADWGSAAVRIPATSPEFEYPKLIKAVLTKVQPILSALGASVDTAGLDQAMAAVMDTNDPRDRAVRISQATVLAHTQDANLACAAGMLQHLVEDQPSNSITKSFGFKRLVNEYPAEVSMGRTLARAHAARQREAIASGNPVNIAIVFVPVA